MYIRNCSASIARLLIAGICFGLASLATAGAYEDVIDAIKRDDARTVVELVRKGVDVDTVDAQGNTLAIIAAREGSLAALKAVVAAGAKISAVNRLGESALMYGSISGHLEIVRYLLVQGARVDDAGWTALQYAATKGNVAVARLLLAYGAQIDGKGPNGLTAMMMAVREGQAEMVSFLLSSGADPNVENDAGINALAMARKSQNGEILARLIKGGGK